MVSLVPPSGSVLINTPANNTLTSQVEAIGFTGVVTWTWQLSPQGDAPSGGSNFGITSSGEKLHISYASGNGLFPIAHIDYLATAYKDSRVRIYSWDDLPPPIKSPYIVSVAPVSVSAYQWTLSVTATGFIEVEEEDPITLAITTVLEEESISGSYTIIIQANHGSVKERLAYELALRKDL